MSKTLPWVGALIALATVAAAIRRKGWLGGSVDTALNAIPFVGGAKNAYEWARGRDLIRDRVRPAAYATARRPGRFGEPRRSSLAVTGE